ncbi:MAG: signal peptidase I [Bdellovibrionaceae bacterium]|nr:signal peptidase I [Pseudobdellovibrionaceae bacterium]
MKIINSKNSVEDSIKKVLREYTEALLIALIIAVIVRTFIFSAYKIPTEAMYPTLQVGDFVIGSKLSYGWRVPFLKDQIFYKKSPQRGDVIIFNCVKSGSGDCVKRVIAVPGDRIQIVKKNLFINNTKADYVISSSDQMGKANLVEKIGASERIISITHSRILENYGPVIVPPGQYFVLGDARDGTEDSRVWGMISGADIKAKALFIWMSLDWSEVWSNKGSVKVRWERIFRKIK